MQTSLRTIGFTLVALGCQTAHAHSTSPNPAGHAPAGVMFEHMHKAGGAMLGYRLVRAHQNQLYLGSQRLGPADLAAAGFSGIPQNMSMQMHMLDLMYAPSDNLNLMLMPQYMSMEMSMQMLAGGGHGEHGHGHATAGSHHHEVAGIGDTLVAGLFRITDATDQNLHAALAVSIPTGRVDEKGADGRFVHYGMQLGSGTWDLLPSLTYNGFDGAISWGAQLGATLRLENKNDSGFSVGDQYRATGWGAYRAADWASFSLRMQYTDEKSLHGHYNGPHHHSSPADLQANYGKEVWELGLGANLVVPLGPLAGQRLGFEWLEPVAEHYHGYQLGGGGTLVFNWSAAF